jgi:peptide chain release factor 1
VALEVTAGAVAFASESGGHRWQRIPPSEKRGRVHTSTVTVAVMPVAQEPDGGLDPVDLSWTAVRGSGSGGQARNKTSNAVVMTHVPTGITVRVESDRSQWRNRVAAASILAARVREADESLSQRASDRKRQLGSGQRGDKRRTVRVRDDLVVDHVTGKRMSLRRYQQGHVDDVAC